MVSVAYKMQFVKMDCLSLGLGFRGGGNMPKVIPNWSQSDPNWPQLDPKVIPKWSQSDPKVTQSHLKVTPKWPQSHLKVIPNWSQKRPGPSLNDRSRKTDPTGGLKIVRRWIKGSFWAPWNFGQTAPWDPLKIVALEKLTPQAVAKLSDVEQKCTFEHTDVLIVFNGALDQRLNRI